MDAMAAFHMSQATNARSLSSEDGSSWWQQPMEAPSDRSEDLTAYAQRCLHESRMGQEHWQQQLQKAQLVQSYLGQQQPSQPSQQSSQQPLQQQLQQLQLQQVQPQNVSGLPAELLQQMQQLQLQARNTHSYEGEMYPGMQQQQSLTVSGMQNFQSMPQDLNEEARIEKEQMAQLQRLQLASASYLQQQSQQMSQQQQPQLQAQLPQPPPLQPQQPPQQQGTADLAVTMQQIQQIQQLQQLYTVQKDSKDAVSIGAVLQQLQHKLIASLSSSKDVADLNTKMQMIQQSEIFQQQQVQRQQHVRQNQMQQQMQKIQKKHEQREKQKRREKKALEQGTSPVASHDWSHQHETVSEASEVSPSEDSARHNAWEVATVGTNLESLPEESIADTASTVTVSNRRKKDRKERPGTSSTPGKGDGVSWLLNDGQADGNSEAASEFKDDEDLSLLEPMENARSSQETLEAACQVLYKLNPPTIIAALHLAARHVTPEQTIPPNSPQLATVLGYLRRNLPRIRQVRLLSRLSWTLGKFEVHNADVDAAVLHICETSPGLLHKFSAQDLTNTLWGLARLFPGSQPKGQRHGPRGNPATQAIVLRFADTIVAICAEKAASLTAQCLANALWSAARVGIRGRYMEDFLWNAMVELQQGRQLHHFSTQGLANMLWAIAELKVAGVGSSMQGSEEMTRTACIAVAKAAIPKVMEFQSQELSMMAWAMAKLHGRVMDPKKGRRKANGKVGRSVEVDQLMLCIAEQSHYRLPTLSPQSVSNLSWAFATMEILTEKPEHSRARGFVCAACEEASTRLAEYSPQAVANLLWAAVRTECQGQRLPPEVNRVAAAAAKETTLRMLEFSWRDLAGVVVAVSHRFLRLPEALNFATLLVGHASAHCDELTPQLMLNIAQSSVRIGVAPEQMQRLVDAIARTIQERALVFNDVDLRQWKEVQQKCPPSWTSNMADMSMASTGMMSHDYTYGGGW